MHAGQRCMVLVRSQEFARSLCSVTNESTSASTVLQLVDVVRVLGRVQWGGVSKLHTELVLSDGTPLEGSRKAFGASFEVSETGQPEQWVQTGRHEMQDAMVEKPREFLRDLQLAIESTLLAADLRVKKDSVHIVDMLNDWSRPSSNAGQPAQLREHRRRDCPSAAWHAGSDRHETVCAS
eukprot:982432-Rhodomonas_salina.2